MNPIEISDRLQQTLVNYLTTTFDVNRDDSEEQLARRIRDSLNAPGALFNGPFLELTPPYQTGQTLEDFIEQGVLSPALRDMDCFQQGRPIPLNAPLYTHQETSIVRLSQQQRSIVVSSGTGSGKTECFLIPILNDLLIDDTPGVRALLVYPMNALVNDQLDRLRSLLSGTSITFGRYTSELEQTEEKAREKLGFEPPENEVICRHDIQTGRKIPQILITNYAMLEYLLLRPEDSKLFQSGLWRFVVLDEAHTYTGAQGIEVAMLIRRLKQRLGKQQNEIRCVATSATLTNDGSTAAQFAENLFHEPFTAEDIIFGEIDPDFAPDQQQQITIEPTAYLDERFARLLDSLRCEGPLDVDEITLKMEDIGLIDKNDINIADEDGITGPNFLWRVMQHNPHLSALRKWMLENGDHPVRPDEAARVIFGYDIADEQERLLALYHLIELGALARRSPDEPPLLPARYHLFARPPQGMWVCINPQCPGRESETEDKWSRLFTHHTETCDACGCHAYPITVCRECGQPYLHMSERNRELSPAQPNDQWNDSEARYFTWRPIHENRGLGEEADEDETPTTTSSKLLQEEVTLCTRCGQDTKLCRCDTPQPVTLWRVMEHQETKKRGKQQKRDVPASFLTQCPRCHSKAQRNTEIVTPMTITGQTPLTIITYEMYRYLPESPKDAIASKPGKGRKLLTFYDSRQGAARFAAFLQDTTNQQNYRHIIPVAVRALQQKEAGLPDLEELSKQCVEIAWNYGIFHNDPDMQEWRSRAGRVSRAQRKRLMERTSAEVIAEFTTRRRERQSLEKLGLVAVQYFENEDQARELVTPLAENIHLTIPQTIALVNYLLDDLRRQKVVVLPEGVAPDHPVFGRNEFSPRLVRGNAGQHEEDWLGKTERKGRRRLVKKMLAAGGQPDTSDHIINVMGKIFDWLIHPDTNLLEGSGSSGYQLRFDRMFFDTNADWFRCDNCQRLSARGDDLPCPHPDCTGTMQPYDTGDSQNFFYELFQREIIPLRVEEHTAQLDSIKGREYQERFRDGDINILSCSTTFEMGIDLGDLQAVAMSNVPPTVANYRQRAGRAGRRSSGTAFILTWASDLPHDQTYFRDPSEIIQGQVRVPFIAMDNEFIRRRHVNAILISEFLRYRREGGHDSLRRVGEFFDHDLDVERHMNAVPAWLDNRHQQNVSLLEEFARRVDLPDDPAQVEQWLAGFRSGLEGIDQHYQNIATFYNNEITQAAGRIAENRGRSDDTKTIEHYQKLLERLKRNSLINYLSDRGFLPSYSFPLHTVELLLPPAQHTEHLRLQRDLRQAIREYAPGSEVVADKRIWRSVGLQFFRQTPLQYEYSICHACGHLHIAKASGIPLQNNKCEICGEAFNTTSKKVRSFLEPDGFRTDWKQSGKPAKQYVISNRGAERSALLPPRTPNEQQYGSTPLFYDYQREGRLLYVNEGRSSSGYRICFGCGAVIDRKKTKCERCGDSKIENVALGHIQTTDTLHLRFETHPGLSVPPPDHHSFWLSVMYALLQGASRALQIERRDISGVLYPRQTQQGGWQQTIVLYDDVPGGAGHVRQIMNELPQVIQEALVVLNCTDCDPDTSCTHCLRDYSNQFIWGELRRQEALRYLEAIHATIMNQSHSQQAGRVVALNLPYWLMRQIESTNETVSIAADALTLESPFETARTWLDVLGDLLQRSVAVTLMLRPISLSHGDAANLGIANHLRLLMERGLSLYWLHDDQPVWSIIIDADSPDNCRAIHPVSTQDFRLNAHTGRDGLTTTIRQADVQAAQQQLQTLDTRPAVPAELAPPPDVRVITLTTRSNRTSEAALFGDVFSQPVIRLTVNDPYLVDAERILNRLGAYVALANQHGTLSQVIVQTKRAGLRGMSGSASDQDRHFDKLERKAGCEVKPVYDPKKVEHDRYILIERQNSTRARILIGRGLDFIRSDGSIDPTYIVIQDPIEQ